MKVMLYMDAWPEAMGDPEPVRLEMDSIPPIGATVQLSNDYRDGEVTAWRVARVHWAVRVTLYRNDAPWKWGADEDVSIVLEQLPTLESSVQRPL